MTVTSDRTTRQVLLADGAAVEAPFDPACGACRSPWITDIDRYLSEGLTFSAIRRLMASHHEPRCPNGEILRRHVMHLAPRQRDMRLQLEDPGRSLVDAGTAVDEVVQLGYRRLAAGDMELTGSDWMRALQLQAKFARDSAAIASSEQWQAAFMAFFEAVRKFMPPDQWPAFQRACMMSPEIRAVSSIGAAEQ
jgi:hypothetical protein